MNDETIGQQEAQYSRSLSVLGFGDTADEVEFAALDEARRFFGPDRQLVIVPGYDVFDMPRRGPFAEKFAEQAGGKAYYARIEVREP